MPPTVGSIMQPAEIETLCQRLRELPEPPMRARLSKEDWLGALSVFLLVFFSIFPVVIPFIFMRDAMQALRVSNAIAVAMLFIAGWMFGRITGRRQWVMGGMMVVLGVVLVGITMALGG
jgi:VIT1/CCC1 family predicted Fe2+/Mn2+ transporter